VMHVAMVTSYYPPSTGGMERFVYQLTQRLRARGIKVTVFTGDHFGRTNLSDVVQLRTRAVLLGNPLVPSLFKLSFDSYDILHAHDEHALTSNAVAFVKKEKPFVMHCHGSFSGGSFAWKMFVEFYMHTLGKFTISKADATVALCPTEARQLANYGAKNIRIIPNALNPDEVNLKADPEIFRTRYNLKGKRIVLFVGRLIPLKGAQLIPKIASDFNDDVVFAVVGDGPLRAKLLQEIKERKLKNVISTGRVDSQTLFSAYNACELVIVPSTSEGIPAVVLEAILFGKPLVCSDLPNIRDYFENVCSFAKPGDAKSFAQKVSEVLKKPPQDSQLELAKELVFERFNWERVIQDVLDIYKEVVNK